MTEAQFQALIELIAYMIDEVGAQRFPDVLYNEVRQRAHDLLVKGPIMNCDCPHPAECIASGVCQL